MKARPHCFDRSLAVAKAGQRAVNTFEHCSDQEEQRHRPDSGGAMDFEKYQIGQITRRQGHPRVSQSLAKPLRVAPLRQFLHHRRIDLATIPLDLSVLMVFLPIDRVLSRLCFFFRPVTYLRV